MRISDWSSDVCSSDLAVYSNYLRSGWRTEMDGVPAQLPRQETLEALIGELGIANDSHVVVVSAGTDALDISSAARVYWTFKVIGHDRVSILDGRSEEHTSELQSLMRISYAVFFWKKK